MALGSYSRPGNLAGGEALLALRYWMHVIGTQSEVPRDVVVPQGAIVSANATNTLKKSSKQESAADFAVRGFSRRRFPTSYPCRSVVLPVYCFATFTKSARAFFDE